jgi:hypothetical protein
MSSQATEPATASYVLANKTDDSGPTTAQCGTLSVPPAKHWSTFDAPVEQS